MSQKLLILLFFIGTFFVKSQSLFWNTSVVDAIELSNSQRKPLLLFFTASGTSDKIQNEIFKTPDFASWSAKNVILVKLDFSDPNISPEQKEQINSLRTAFGVNEFPQVCYATASVRKGKTNFNSLGSIAYNNASVKAWITESNSILNPE
ncbi:hypothetical protein [Flavobacterium hercynium]|uniref:Thioredoxin family protein n=1 Tax=Flavobacterium hercynium TaxID=387094 RepID=A0A226HF03_9FLAO|nr:hypothetical protein [Flavobacterium hercynium]OXA92867.1 hypothetical protein B0A66_08840 [Flavobacterium hercynium]SMP02958.1 hypothetical protein SAMN06265346_101201 [Flavobacterium hercynium]